ARFDKMLSSREIGTIISALGTGIGREDFDLSKLRYHKVVIMTDADVDGAHIRTLLLTFFYRQMREMVEAGHLYIAQPPLYKVAKGRSEVYLKDDAALDNYLVDAGLSDTALVTANGQRGGDDLRNLVQHARRIRMLLDYVPPRYNPLLVEELALTGGLDPELAGDEAGKARHAALVADRLNAWDDGEWIGEAAATGGYHFVRTSRGVADHYVIDRGLLVSAESRKLHAAASEEAESYAQPAKLGDATIRRPTDLLERVLTVGRKGLSIQRYKGLGEMNPEQLW